MPKVSRFEVHSTGGEGLNAIQLVITGAVPYHGVTQRPQHFAKLLAERGWDVLYVDAPITLLGPIRNPELLSRFFPAERITEVKVDGNRGRLRVLSPVVALPLGNRYRSLNRLNQRLLAYQIRKNLSGPYLLLPLLPGSVDLVPLLRPMAVVYDCVDLHTGFGGLQDPQIVNQMEQELVYSSRAVLATSDLLQERMSAWHSDVHLLPNAAEIEHFQTALRAPIHELLRSIPEPRIGLIGGIGPWVDLQFVRELAEAKPDVQLVMIGPVETDVSELQRLPNVHFLGRQPYASLPQFLAGFSATLVSFVRNELTRGVNPIKVYEYLAADKQVIATANHELLKISDMIWIAQDGKQAASHLTRILSGERRADAEEQLRFSYGHSWSVEADRLDRILKEVLPDTYRKNAL